MFLCDIDIVPSIQRSVVHVHSMGTWSFPDTRTLNALFRLATHRVKSTVDFVVNRPSGSIRSVLEEAVRNQLQISRFSSTYATQVLNHE